MNQPGDSERRRPKRGVAGGARQTDETFTAPFEEQLADLDEIVATLEEGKLPLDDALALYERGVRLAQACQRRLDEADLRVRRLRATSDADAASNGNGQAFAVESLDLDGA